MGWEEVVESRIRDAIEAGAFDNLAGAGKPLRDPRDEQFAGTNWLGFKVLQNGGMLPEWLELAKEIERDLERLARLDSEHARLVAAAAASGAWEGYAASIRHARDAYERMARAIRRKQDRHNLDAPALVAERPGIWVEHHLARLDQRLVAAGAPDTLPPPASV
ncbi:MAG: DUF1992 domain-containing protein [Chloroflexi bacterium]|nr:DUF1992 domain-containing protein [Chloroflexota bacterium]